MTTGNLINRIRENSVNDVPEVGQGCTIYYYTDRDAATVIEVKSPTRIVIQEDDVEFDESGYASKITQNPEGKKHEVIKTKKGWKILKRTTRVRLGFREPYYDWSF